MKKRLEQLMLMGILSISILSTGVIGCAQDTGTAFATMAETEPASVAEMQVTETMVTEAPVTEAPVTEAPVINTPVTEAPVAELPSTEASTTDLPITEVPTTELPITEEPVTDMTVTEETEIVTELESNAETEVESETATEWEVVDALQEAVEIIDNSIDEEKIAKIEADAKKKTAEVKKKKEEAKKQYEMRIGESVIDFNAYPAGNITENTNKIYDYLRNVMGLNHAATCGILANIQCESNFAPTAIGDGGTSYGLCQWHLERFARLVSWCNENGYNYHLVEGQMGYLQYELETLYTDVYNYVQQVSDTEQGAYDAAYYWCAYYEMPSDTIARAKQRGNMAMNEFFPKKLGLSEEQKKGTVCNSESILRVEEEKTINLWDETSELVFQMYRLNIPQENLLILR